MGQGALHPVAIEDHTGALVSEGEFFFWNFGNKFAYFGQNTVMHSEIKLWLGKKPGEHLYFMDLPPNDEQLAFSWDCIDGPDVWREKYLKSGTMMSSAMAAGLTAAGLAKTFELIKCRVV